MALANRIKTLEDIDQLQEINGVTLSEIHRRAKPLVDKFEDPSSYRFRSHQGFLCEDETFQERLRADSAIVSSMGLTHAEMADKLRGVIAEAESERKRNNWGRDTPIRINYGPSTDPQELLIEHRTFMGSQWSLFYSPDQPDTPESQMNWSEDYTISNGNLPSSLGFRLLIAGNNQVGILHYISEYGFYEGGALNNYRVDPELVLCVLSGKCTTKVIEILKKYTIARIDDYTKQSAELFEGEIEELQARVKGLNDFTW